MYNYEQIAEVLTSIKNKIDNGAIFYLGICRLVECKIDSNLCNFWAKTRADAFECWDKFSGNWLYPVPSPDKEITPEDYYIEHNKWTGEYGKLRMELLDHLIDWYSKKTH